MSDYNLIREMLNAILGFVSVAAAKVSDPYSVEENSKRFLQDFSAVDLGGEMAEYNKDYCSSGFFNSYYGVTN